MIKFSFFLSIYLLWETYRDCFHVFLSLYVFVRFLTWRARHSQPPFATRRLRFMKSASLTWTSDLEGS